MAKYNSYELFNIVDIETLEVLRGLTRDELVQFVAGTYKTKFYHSYQPACHKIQHEVHNSDGIFFQGFDIKNFLKTGKVIE